jgi:hypothetical protein
VDGASQRHHVAVAGVAVGVMSEILVSSITEASESLGLSPFFVGVIVVAVVGNAAEHWVAVYFATRDKMGLAVNIAVGSGAQIALFAAASSYSRRSSSVHSRWHWSSTGSSSAQSSWRSSSQTRSPNVESPRGTKGCNCSRDLCGTGADVLLRVVVQPRRPESGPTVEAPSRLGHRSRHRRIDRECLRKIVHGQI